MESAAFGGGVAAAALTPVAAVLLPLVGGGELTYLDGAGLDSPIPCRDRRESPRAGIRRRRSTAPQAPPVSLCHDAERACRATARTRFERLHARCLEMRGIAAGVRGAAGDQSAGRGNPDARARSAALAVPAAAAVEEPRSTAFCRR